MGMYKKEHRLMGRFKKSFGRKKEESEDQEQAKPMELFQPRKERVYTLNEPLDEEDEPHSVQYGSKGHSTDENRMYGENDWSEDEGYDSIPSDDDEEYEKEQREEFSKDTGPQLSKSQRKRLAVASISRKMSKPKKR